MTTAIKVEVAVRIKLYIDEHYMDEQNLDTYCKISGYSRSYTANMFKEATGFTIGWYLQYVRLEHLKELLLTTRRPFYQLISDVGWASPGRVWMLFKEKTGCSPREFRKICG